MKRVINGGTKTVNESPLEAKTRCISGTVCWSPTYLLMIKESDCHITTVLHGLQIICKWF